MSRAKTTGSGFFEPRVTVPSSFSRTEGYKDSVFAEPPAYPQMGGLNGASKIGGKNSMVVGKKPSSRNP